MTNTTVSSAYTYKKKQKNYTSIRALEPQVSSDMLIILKIAKVA
jgi:hypothetical protein